MDVDGRVRGPAQTGDQIGEEQQRRREMPVRDIDVKYVGMAFDAGKRA
jgi:hypothetical protein